MFSKLKTLWVAFWTAFMVNFGAASVGAKEDKAAVKRAYRRKEINAKVKKLSEKELADEFYYTHGIANKPKRKSKRV